MTALVTFAQDFQYLHVVTPDRFAPFKHRGHGRDAELIAPHHDRAHMLSPPFSGSQTVWNQLYMIRAQKASNVDGLSSTNRSSIMRALVFPRAGAECMTARRLLPREST